MKAAPLSHPPSSVCLIYNQAPVLFLPQLHLRKHPVQFPFPIQTVFLLPFLSLSLHPTSVLLLSPALKPLLIPWFLLNLLFHLFPFLQVLLLKTPFLLPKNSQQVHLPHSQPLHLKMIPFPQSLTHSRFPAQTLLPVPLHGSQTL